MLELFPEMEIKFSWENRQYLRSDLGNLIKVHKKIIGEENNKASWKIASIKSELYTLTDGKNYLIKGEDGIHHLGGSGENITDKFFTIMHKKFVLIPAIRDIKEEGRVGNVPNPNGDFVVNAYFNCETDASINKYQVFKKVNEEIKKIFPEFQEIKAKQYGADKRVLFFDSFSSSCVGTGVNQWFNNIFQLNFVEWLIFGIEEPEAHLHPEAQRKVFNFLKEKSKEKQIIFATHSPIFTEIGNKTKLYLVKKGKELPMEPKLLENRNDFKLIKYELGAKNTDLFFYNMVVLIEGYTEEGALPILFNAYNYNLDALGIKLINLKGQDKIKKEKIREFLEYLKDSDVKKFVILDKNEETERYAEELIKLELLEETNFHIWTKGDFEDCFSEEQIIKAMRNIHGEKFDITQEQLKEIRRTNEPTTKILKKILYEKELGDLNKPDLGEKLAFIIKDEIVTLKNEEEREKMEPEKVIEKIVSLVATED